MVGAVLVRIIDATDEIELEYRLVRKFSKAHGVLIHLGYEFLSGSKINRHVGYLRFSITTDVWEVIQESVSRALFWNKFYSADVGINIYGASISYIFYEKSHLSHAECMPVLVTDEWLERLWRATVDYERCML